VTTLFGDHPATAPLEDADVQFLDTTLRDGEQAPGISLTPDEKPRSLWRSMRPMSP